MIALMLLLLAAQTAGPCLRAAVAAGKDGLYLLAEPLPLDVRKPTLERAPSGCPIVGCEAENQTLPLSVPLAGTSYTLNYSSDRVPGGHPITIPLVGKTLNDKIEHIDVTVHVAGRAFTKRFDKSDLEPNLRVAFVWDGKDENDEVLLGAQPAEVMVEEISKNHDGDEAPWITRMWNGTIGSWDTRAQGLGGWSLSMHHFFDPLEQILYLGTGERRFGPDLGPVSEENDELFIPSADGLEVYVFDADTGAHTKTLNALTKAAVFTFEYDSDGHLTTVEDGDDNALEITPEAEAPSAFKPPFDGPTTSVDPDAEGFITSLTGGYEFSFETTEKPSEPFRKPDEEPGEGLVTTLTDPKGQAYAFTYATSGTLERGADPDQGDNEIHREDEALDPDSALTAQYKMTVGTGAGRSFTHQVEHRKNGSSRFTLDGPFGTTTAEVSSEDRWQTTYPDGTATDAHGLPGRSAALDVNLPPGWGSVQSNYSTRRGTPDDPRTLDEVTISTAFNDVRAKTVVTGTNVETTTPAGRKIQTTLDDQGRPLTITPPAGLDPIEFHYEHGRLESVTQTDRTVQLGYTVRISPV